MEKLDGGNSPSSITFTRQKTMMMSSVSSSCVSRPSSSWVFCVTEGKRKRKRLITSIFGGSNNSNNNQVFWGIFHFIQYNTTFAAFFKHQTTADVIPGQGLK